MAYSSDHAPVKQGDILAGRYRVERMLGAGGMGIVVQATHLDLERPVAVKFLLPQASANPALVERFLQEGKAAVKLKSQHVTRVLDVGRLEHGEPFIVMEFLAGTTLGHVLDTRGQLPVELAVGYLLQSAEAIAEAHSIGIVHRDLKPDNLFLTKGPDGQDLLKVLDFGISKSLDKQGMSMTQTDSVMGSPGYMSPEQMRSAKNVDGRSDIWSLGVILYEALCGRRPYDAESLPALVFMLTEGPPPDPRTFRTDLPAPLAAFILSCLERDRNKRCASTSEFARGLEPFASPKDAERVQRVLATGGDATRGADSAESSSQIQIELEPLSEAHQRASTRPETTSGVTKITGSGAKVLDAGAEAQEPAAVRTLESPQAPARSRAPLLIVGALVAAGVAGLGFKAVQKPAASIEQATPQQVASAAATQSGMLATTVPSGGSLATSTASTPTAAATTTAGISAAGSAARPGTPMSNKVPAAPRTASPGVASSPAAPPPVPVASTPAIPAPPTTFVRSRE